MRPILFLDHAQALGGAEQSLLTLLKHLDRQRWRPHLACVPGPLAEKAGEMDVIVHPMEFPRLRHSLRFGLDLWAGVRTITTLSREINACVLYANTVRSSLYSAFAAPLARLPFIWHLRDFWLSEAKPRYLVLDHLGKRFLLNAAAMVITNSHAVARALPHSRKISVIHNAVELDKYFQVPSGTSFRAKHTIDEEAPVIGMVARLRPWKGQISFIRAMQQVAKSKSKARFLIVGGNIFDIPDDYEQKLERLLTEQGLSDQVIFTGHLEDVRPALAAMDVFVHPGDPEPFGLVNIEAMAMGKPVVAYAHGALPEIVINGETGWLVPPGDESALSDAVLALLNDPARRHRMGLAGRKRVETYFTAQRMTHDIEQLLSGLMQ